VPSSIDADAYVLPGLLLRELISGECMVGL
jgi:hypothetical protein